MPNYQAISALNQLDEAHFEIANIVENSSVIQLYLSADIIPSTSGPTEELLIWIELFGIPALTESYRAQTTPIFTHGLGGLVQHGADSGFLLFKSHSNAPFYFSLNISITNNTNLINTHGTCNVYSSGYPDKFVTWQSSGQYPNNPSHDAVIYSSLRLKGSALSGQDYNFEVNNISGGLHLFP